MATWSHRVTMITELVSVDENGTVWCAGGSCTMTKGMVMSTLKAFV